MDIEEIRSQLQSEKPTIRKKGKLALEDEIIKKKICLSSFETMNLIYAIMSYEKKEIDALQAKGKTITTEASQFFKQVIKYCLRCGQFISSKMIEVIDYSLQIFFDPSLPPIIKQIHKSTLCDLLETKIVYAIPFECKIKQTGWKRLFVYLKHVMVDKRNAAETTNLKLLKAICFNLYNDFQFQSLTSKSGRAGAGQKKKRGRGELEQGDDEMDEENSDGGDEITYIPSKKILRPLLGWFRQLLSFADDNDENSLLIISSVYECLTALLQFHSLNIINLLLDELNQYCLSFLLKHICSIQYLQEKYSEPLLMFVHVLVEKLLSISSDPILYASLVSLPSFYTLLNSLYEGLLGDDYLISILSNCRKKQTRKVSSGTTSSSSSASSTGNQPFTHIIDDIQQGKLVFAVITNVIRLYVKLWNRFTVKQDFLHLEENNDEQKVRTAENEENVSPRAGKRSRKEKSVNVGFHRVFERIQTLTLLSNSLYETGSENKISIANKRFLNNPVKRVSDRLLSNDIVLLESLLWLVIAATSSENIEDFLSLNDRQTNSDHLMSLNQWIKIIQQQFRTMIQFKDEKQVIGTFLLVLAQVWSISSLLLSESAKDRIEEELLFELKNLYLQITHLLSEHEKSFFKIMNNRVIGLNIFHSQLFYLISVLLSHPLSELNDSGGHLCSVLSKWQVFQPRKFTVSTSVDGNEMEQEDDEIVIADPNEKFQQVTEALACPHYISVLRLIGRRQMMVSHPESISGIFSRRRIFYLQAWFIAVLEGFATINYTFSSSFVLNHRDDVLDALQKMMDDAFSDEMKVIPCGKETSKKKLIIRWEESKDLFLLYPKESTQSVSLINFEEKKENKEIRDFLEECYFMWKSKIADLIKMSNPIAETVQNLLRIGLYITCLFKQYSEVTRVSCIEIIDIMQNMFDCILVNFQLLSTTDVINTLSATVTNIFFRGSIQIPIKPNDSMRELLFKILMALLTKLSKSKLSKSSSGASSSQNLTVVEDDFMDDIPELNSSGPSEKAKASRVELSQDSARSTSTNSWSASDFSEILDFLLVISQLQLCFSAPNQRPAVISRLIEFLKQLNTASGEDNQVTFSETILLFAEKASLVFFPGCDLLVNEVLGQFPWNKIHLEWAHFACLKVFHILFNLVKDSGFWATRNQQELTVEEDAIISFLLEKIFPEEGSMEDRMLHQIWQLRYYQMKLILEVMKHVGNINAVKAEVTTVFLSAIVDVDIHVRMIAAQNVTLLFRHFKNPSKVYISIHEKLLVSLQDTIQENSDSDPVETAVLFLLYSNAAGTTNVELIPKILLDLFNFVYPTLDSIIEGSRSVYRDIMLQTLSKMAQAQGYLTRRSFILDYLYFLLQIWFQNVKEPNLIAAETALKSFPYEIVFEEFHYVTWEKRNALLSYFLIDFGQLLLPSIIQITALPRVRWALLTAFAKSLYGGEGDNEIIRSLQSNYVSCKILQVQLLVKYELLKKTPAGGINQQTLIEQNTKCKEITDFLTRLFPNKDMNHQMKKDVTGYIHQLILFLTSYSSDDLQSGVENSSNAILLSKNFIFGILTQLQQQMSLSNLNQLFYLINVLDTISFIVERLQSSALMSSSRNVLLFILILLENSDFIVNRRMVLIEIQKIFLFIVLSYKSTVLRESITEQCLPIIVDCSLLLLQKMKGFSTVLSNPIKYLWMKDLLMGSVCLYWIMVGSKTLSAISPLSYQLLEGSIPRDCIYPDALSQRMKDAVLQMMEFMKVEFKSSFIPWQSLFLCLLPQTTLLLLGKDVEESSSEENLLLACADCLQEGIDDLLGGLDNWSNVAFLLIRLEELIDRELAFMNDESATRQQQRNIYTLDEKLMSSLLALCQYIDRLKKTNFFLRCSIFSQLTTIIIHLINKIKNFLFSAQNYNTSSASIKLGQLNLFSFHSMNSVVQSTDYDPQKLQKQVILLSYKLMTQYSLNADNRPSYSTVSLALTNLAIQGYFVDETNLQQSQANTAGSGSSQFNSVINKSSDISGSLSQTEASVLTTGPDVPRSGVDFVYESVCSHYRLAANYSASNNILSEHHQLDQALIYKLFDGNHELCRSMFLNPSEFIWNEKLWNCNYFIPMKHTSDSIGQSPTFNTHQIYSSWIRRISYCLVQAFLTQVKNAPNTSSSVRSKGGRSSNKSPAVLNNKLLFLLSCSYSLCLFSEEISEIVFLLILNESVTCFGVQSTFVASLFDHINRFIVKGKGITSGLAVFRECYRLVGNIFTMLLQKTIHVIPVGINELGEYEDGAPTASSRGKTSRQLLHVKFAAEYHSSINLLDVIEVLYDSKLLSTALLLTELVAESMGVKGLHDLKNEIYELQLMIQAASSSSTAVLGLRRESTLRSDEDTLEADKLKERYQSFVRLQRLFSLLYRESNDIDAIEAINRSADLQLQAICYQRKEQYFEALTTYESILQANKGTGEHDLQSREDTRADVSSGIAESLAGLGATQAKRYYLEAMKKERLSVNDTAQNYLQEWSIEDTSVIHQSYSTPFSKTPDRSSLHPSILSLVSVYGKFSTSTMKLLTLENNDAVNREILRMYDVFTIWKIKNSDFGPAITISQPSSSSANASVAVTPIKSNVTKSIGRILRDMLSRGSKVSDYQKNLNLIHDLISNRSMTSLDGLLAINRVDDAIQNSAAIHSISPTFYRCWNQIQLSISLPDENEEHSLQRSGGWNLTEKEVLTPVMQLQECKLLWKKGLSEAALDRLMTVVLPVFSDIQERSKSIVSKASRSSNPSNQTLLPVVMDCLSEALRLGGLWNSRKGSQASQEIIQRYFQPAIDHASSLQHKVQSYLALATFTSTLFSNIQSRIQSMEWIQSERVFHDREEELKLCLELQQEQSKTPQQPQTKDQEALDLQVHENRNLLRHIIILKKEIDMDKKERTQLIRSYNQYLLLAIENYLKLLYLSDDQDVDVVFRFINLWFKNNFPVITDHSPSSQSSMGSISVNVTLLNDLILQYLQQQKILSYKFIPLHYQIFSRLGQTVTPSPSSEPSASSSSKGSEDSGFQHLLQQFMQLLCYDHPYHVIPQLFALIHEQTVDSALFKSNNQSSRSELATGILQKLTKPSGTSSTSARSTGKTKNIKFKEIQPRGKRFNEITSLFVSPSSAPGGNVIPAVITLSVPINKWKKYDAANSTNPNHNLIRMKEILPQFHITQNGISRPKIISCLGENGVIYKQLVKGGDDMRQDAVMEQVFENINLTFQRNCETNLRNLLIRTYKVIPLTPQTGIVQWVENTLPFGAILCDRVNGLHTRYQQTLNQDWTHKQCRELLQSCQDISEKETKFNEICQHFHPMFRYFFIEKFSSHPMEWMQRRLNYIKSVASNSMTGYILGIGDRHAHNILIDQITGECVHIDFGIVFDQGKGLGTPETVPFRLTRDIIDGMGINGVEGTFRRCCEEVLKVLRENSFNLLTILEVVIYDPLYKWSLSPLKARNKQQITTDQQNQTNEVPGNRGGDEIDQQVPDFHENILRRKRNLRKQDKLTAVTNNPASTVVGGEGAGKQAPGNFKKDAAERTIMKIRNKLRGYEGMSYESLTVEGHVDMLINEAKDPLNLCRIFPGWAPWL